MRKTLIAAVLVAPALALASGYEAPNINPRDLAMVSSTVAAQPGEAAATNVNPAALSRVDGLTLSLSGSLLHVATEWNAPAAAAPNLTGSAETDLHPAPPVSLFVAYGTKLADWGNRGVGVGFGMGNPAGANMFWDEDWQGRGRIIDVERRFYGFYLNGGVELIPDMLRIGGGAIYYHATQLLRQGVQPVPGAIAEVATKGGAFSYEAAAELKPFRNVPLTVGIDYKHKAHTQQEGEANFDVPSSLLSTTIQDQDVESSLVMPNILHVGLGYRPLKPLLLTAGWSFVRFVVYQEDRFLGETGLEIIVPRNYSNGYGLRLGAEYDINPSWTVRGGFFRDISGLDTDFYSPTLPDSDSWVVAGGASYRFSKAFAINGAFYYADRDSVSATNTTVTNPEGSFPGDYKARAYVASLGITWHSGWGAGE